MTCFKPIKAYKLIGPKTEKGKDVIVFSEGDIGCNPFMKIKLPCNGCRGCRNQRAREWAIRCVHEASLHEDNCYLTLTYREEDLQYGRSLFHKDFQLFMKRLRESEKNLKLKAIKAELSQDEFMRVKDKVKVNIRYFQCGEYGERLRRPHHHAIIFNYDVPYKSEKFPEGKVYHKSSKGHPLYISEYMDKIWSHGHVYIGSVTVESAQYVAGYIQKKQNGSRAIERYLTDVDPISGECNFLKREYSTSSKRPAIGKDWFNKFKNDCNKDYVTQDGDKFKLPKYYDKLFERIDPDGIEKLKFKRLVNVHLNKDEYDPRRLRSKEKVLIAKHKLKERGYENGINVHDSI